MLDAENWNCLEWTISTATAMATEIKRIITKFNNIDNKFLDAEISGSNKKSRRNCLLFL